MTARSFYPDYLECARAAREYATFMRMDVVIRKVSEFGRKGFVFYLKSNDGSDYLAETIKPGEPL